MPKCLRNFEFIYEGVTKINLMSEKFLRVPNFLINMSLTAKLYMAPTVSSISVKLRRWNGLSN